MKKKQNSAKKSGPKKSESKCRKATAQSPKRRRFVSGLIDGKSMRRAALDAGYSQAMADKAGQKILPGAQEEFREELAKRIPLEKLLDRIAQGLDAYETEFAKSEGRITDRQQLISWSERRHYAELIAKLQGYLIQKVELAQSTDHPLNFDLNVHFVDDPEGDGSGKTKA